MSKHTPGPWKVERIGIERGRTERGMLFRIDAPDACHVRDSQIAVLYPKRQFEDAEANARLIAKAPELYEALRNLLTVENKSWAAYIRTEFAAARALLAEIDGGEE